jgi:hypothetical protein
MTATADDGLPLVGTLPLPAGPGPHPAILLLHGSGRLDRDANTGRLRMELRPPPAVALTKDGIALRTPVVRRCAPIPGRRTPTCSRRWSTGSPTDSGKRPRRFATQTGRILP